MLRGDHPTDQIIETAIKDNRIHELDNLSQQLAVNYYNRFISKGLLFLNVHPNSIPYLKHRTEGNIVFEVTEHQPHNKEETIKALKRMKSEGTKIAMDDYGVGFSNLKNFKKIEPNFVKLDKSLIQNLHSLKILSNVKTILSLCQEKEIQVIAEGIETADELNICKQLGIHYGQGYYLGIPFIPSITRV